MAETPQNPGYKLGRILDRHSGPASQVSGVGDLDILDRFTRAIESSGRRRDEELPVMPERLVPVIERQIQQIQAKISWLTANCLQFVDLLAATRDDLTTRQVVYEPRIVREIAGGRHSLNTPFSVTHSHCESVTHGSYPEWIIEYVCSDPATADFIRRCIESQCLEVIITDQTQDSISGRSDISPVTLREVPCAKTTEGFPAVNTTSQQKIVHYPMAIESGRRFDTGNFLAGDSNYPMYCYEGRLEAFVPRAIAATVFTAKIRIKNCLKCRVAPQNKSARDAAPEAQREVARLQATKTRLEEAIVDVLTKRR